MPVLTKPKPKKPVERANAILTDSDLQRIMREIEEARKASTKIVKVPGYKRRIFMPPKQIRKDRAFMGIERLLNLADSLGVTERDVEHCRIAIKLLHAKFLNGKH